MKSFISGNNGFLRNLIICSTLFYLQQSYAITPQELPPEDLEWYKNQVINTHRTLDEQARDDVNKGIGDRGYYKKWNDELDKKNKDEEIKKEMKKLENSNCINVSSIVFDGGDMIKRHVREKINNKYTNKCLTSLDIEDAMSMLVNWFLSNGLSTTRVYLEAQDLNSGILRLRIEAGIISDIILEDGDKKSIYLPTLFPFVKGKTLNLSKIEQGIHQANKQRSNKATMDIVPGEKSGDSIIVIKNDKSFPVHLNSSIDNHGSESTGKIQASATVTADNFIGLNDTLTFTHRQSIPSLDINGPGESMSDSLALMIPVGFFTYTLSYSRSTYESMLNSPSGSLLISSGSTYSVNATIDRVMYRKSDTIINSYLKLNYNIGKNFLNGEFLDVSSKKTTSMTIGSAFNSRVFDNPISLSIDYSIGLPLFGAVKNTGSPESFPVNLFKKIGINLSYTQPISFISDKLALTSSLSGQYAFNNMPSSQRISIGSKSSVRGYVKNSLSGDNGVYIRNEMSWRNAYRNESGSVSASINARYDIGWVRNRHDSNSGNDGELSGASIGLTIYWKDLVSSFDYDFPLHKPSFLPRERGQFWWRFSVDI